MNCQFNNCAHHGKTSCPNPPGPYCDSFKSKYKATESPAPSGQPELALLYRKLELGEKIKAGDQWLNHDWEIGGPWYTIKENSKYVGVKYESCFREMRRAA